MHIQLGILDYAILLIYVGFVIGIGFALTRYMKTSSDFLTSGRSIPAWVTGLAFISANLGALELVGMAASGAKYGIATGPFLLGWRHSGHGLPRRLHDALLLRLQGPLGARIPQDALRRARPRPQLHLLRRHDASSPPASP